MYVNKNRTGVVFLAHLKVVQFSVLAQILSANRCHVHKGEGLILALCIDVSMHCLVFVQTFLKEFGIGAFVNLDIFEHRIEGGMTAVVRPVGVKHADFCFRGVTLDALKIVLQKFDVGRIHGKPHLCAVGFQFFFAPSDKISYHRNVAGLFGFHFQCFGNAVVRKP